MSLPRHQENHCLLKHTPYQYYCLRRKNKLFVPERETSPRSSLQNDRCHSKLKILDKPQYYIDMSMWLLAHAQAFFNVFPSTGSFRKMGLDSKQSNSLLMLMSPAKHCDGNHRSPRYAQVYTSHIILYVAPRQPFQRMTPKLRMGSTARVENKAFQGYTDASSYCCLFSVSCVFLRRHFIPLFEWENNRSFLFFRNYSNSPIYIGGNTMLRVHFTNILLGVCRESSRKMKITFSGKNVSGWM